MINSCSPSFPLILEKVDERGRNQQAELQEKFVVHDCSHNFNLDAPKLASILNTFWKILPSFREMRHFSATREFWLFGRIVHRCARGLPAIHCAILQLELFCGLARADDNSGS